MAVVVRILSELAFFLSLVLLSEAVRREVRRRRPKSQQLAQALLVCSLVLGWYSVSITLVLFNKWLVSSWGESGLKFPIFYSMTHMLYKGIFAFSYQRCVRCQPLPAIGWNVLKGTALVGVMTGLDIATSNASFLYISVSFFTMLKSASLVFLMALGVATGVEPCSLKVGGAVMVIAGGILLASYGEARFDARGFSLVILSELFAAVRWIVTQMILHKSPLGTVLTVFYMSPASTLSLLPLAAALEFKELAGLADPGAAVQYLCLVLFPGFLAFILLLVEVQLVRETSSLTLSVFGNLKSIVTIIFAILVFGETASLLQWCGLSAALCGMFAYSYIKKKAMQVDALASLGYVALTEEEFEENGACDGDQTRSPETSPAAAPGGSQPGLEDGRCRAEASVPSIGLSEAENGCAPQVLGLPSTLRAAAGSQDADALEFPLPEPPPSGASDAVDGLDSPPDSSAASGTDGEGGRSLGQGPAGPAASTSAGSPEEPGAPPEAEPPPEASAAAEPGDG